MQVSELFDIEPSHTELAEISRRRIDYGGGWTPTGYATLWLAGRVPGAALGAKAVFRIAGVRGEMLLVRYEGRRLAPSPGGGYLAEPYVWVHGSVFPDGIEILSKVLQPLPERYWHPNWREISALPPARSD